MDDTKVASTKLHASGAPRSWLSQAFARKPLFVALEEERIRNQSHTSIARHFSLYDLVCIGVGGTIGSGVFVLIGFVANAYAGPATILSFAIAGFAAICSGICYAEIGARIPVSGSAYVYSYICLGELPAVWAAACLTLEYGVSASAVARSWGDKVIDWLNHELGWTESAKYLEYGYGVNLMAFLIAAFCTGLLAYGIKESKRFTNVFTILKLAVVLFATIGGLVFFNSSNLKPFVPMGVPGIMSGATNCFFGYLGYDEVCCVSGEAINPRRDVPRAVMLTLLIVTVLYILAALALTGMQPSALIDQNSGFPVAFNYNGAHWAAQLEAAGEVLTLPVVVLISQLAQPRLQQSMARDGLLPELFCRLDKKGNLFWGALISGIVMTLIATFVPFNDLNDFISAGILIGFSMTNSSLILLRMESPPSRPNFLPQALVVFHLFCISLGMVLSKGTPGLAVKMVFTALTVVIALGIAYTCPRSSGFGGNILRGADRSLVAPEKGFTDKDYFEAPFMPYLPFIGIFANWYLVSQLGLYGLATVLLYFILVAILYFYFAKPKADDRLAIWQNVYADMTVQSKEENNSVVEEETSNEKEEHDNDVHPTDAVTE
jgi:APA family basic amino acid/polyamine antiporter